MAFRVSILQDYARLAELDRLYKAYRGRHLPVPDAQELWQAGEDGCLFVVDRFEAAGERTMVAAAGLFPVSAAKATETSGVVQVMELAGMVMNGQVLGGFGIQEIMIALRTLAIASVERRGVCMIASVVAENLRSMENLKKCGLIEAETPAWLRSVARGWCLDDKPVKNLVVPPAAICLHARKILELREKSTLSRKNRTTGEKETIKIELDVPWVLNENSIIEKFKNGYRVDWYEIIPVARLVGGIAGYVEFTGK